jgi:hypothetical protein
MHPLLQPNPTHPFILPFTFRYFEWNPFSCLRDPSWLALMHNIQATQSPMLHLYLTATTHTDEVTGLPWADAHTHKQKHRLAYSMNIHMSIVTEDDPLELTCEQTLSLLEMVKYT